MIKKIVYVIGAFTLIDFVFDKIEDAIDWAYEKGFDAGWECCEDGMTYEKAKKEYVNATKRVKH